MNKVWIALLCLVVSTGVVNAQDAKQPLAPAQAPKVDRPAALPGTTDAAAAPNPDAGKFKFREETHDFEEIMEGPLAECDFEFKNVGKEPIIITEAHGSCGCTVPSWPKEPILPKHKGIIHVTYNTQGRIGPINKDVIITSNALQNPVKLHLTGMVKPKPESDKPAPPPTPPPAK